MENIEELLDRTNQEAMGRRVTFREVAVIAISIVVFTVMAVPYFSRQRQIMHSEVRATLSDLRMMVEAYRSEYGRYTGSLEYLIYQQPSGSMYSYWIESATMDDCVIKAAGKEGEPSEGELWELLIIDKVAAAPRMK